MLFEFPKFSTIVEANHSFDLIVDALQTMQYSGRNEGRNNSARRKHRMSMNTYAEEFAARCNSKARASKDDPKVSQQWHELRNRMINEASSLQQTKEKLQDMFTSVW